MSRMAVLNRAPLILEYFPIGDARPGGVKAAPQKRKLSFSFAPATRPALRKIGAPGPDHTRTLELKRWTVRPPASYSGRLYFLTSPRKARPRFPGSVSPTNPRMSRP